MITILSIYDRICCFHTLRPFLLHKDSNLFTFTDNPDYCLKKDKNRILILVRWYVKPDKVDIEELIKLREKYDRIIYFHDDAGGALIRTGVLPYVDLFYQKALYKDRSLYKKPHYGKELYSDYYHREFGIKDDQNCSKLPAENPQDLDKLRLSWNIGIGAFPRQTTLQRAAVAWARALRIDDLRYLHRQVDFDKIHRQWQQERPIDLHFRIRMTGVPTLDYQRQKMNELLRDFTNVTRGQVSQKKYLQELLASKIVISPYGWGEVCYRDFEAVMAGAVLIKPDMSHLETWPDIYVPSDAYLPIRWDLSDFQTAIEQGLKCRKDISTACDQAFDHYRDQTAMLAMRFEKILEEICK